MIAQLAASLVLLVSAGLFARALDKGMSVDAGFNSAHVTVAAFDARSYGFDNERSAVFYDQLRERLEANGGLTQVSFARMLPLSSNNSGNENVVDGYAPGGGENAKQEVRVSQVAPSYFDALRIPLLEGRDFRAADRRGASRVAIVNEAFAAKYWPGKAAVGHTFREDSTVFTIVGVVRNSNFAKLNEEPRPFAYFPIAQSRPDRRYLVVRFSLGTAATAEAIRAAVRSLDAQLPVPDVTTLDAVTSVMLLPQRIAASATAAFGVLGLALAAVGLYGIVAYSASQRTREIGVRMALGATRSNVVSLVLHDGLRLALTGLAIGLVLAVAATRLRSAFLFGVSATDALTFVLVPVLLLAIAALASYLPARRAASTDPLVALRAE